MATTPLASKADVEERLRRELTEVEAGPNDRWINGFLEEASALVTTYCGRSFQDDGDPIEVPDVVRLVTSRVAARGVTTIAAAEGGDVRLPTVVGPVQWPAPSADAVAGGGWLTRADRQMLSPWAVKKYVVSLDTR